MILPTSAACGGVPSVWEGRVVRDEAGIVHRWVSLPRLKMGASAAQLLHHVREFMRGIGRHLVGRITAEWVRDTTISVDVVGRRSCDAGYARQREQMVE